jgi:signal transduction histidine kinase/phage shock protein PspC (stress-responsive transcriptional regulator)
MTRSRTTLRRDPAQAILGGVCAGLAGRLGVDPILPRVAVVVVTIGSGGIAAIGYLIAWALIPVDGPRPPRRAASRTRRRRGSWRIAIGVALLALSVLLVFRELGLWWSDAAVWPLTLASFGVALLWGLTRPAPGAEPEDDEAGARPSLAPPPVEEPGERARRVSRAGLGIALVAGAGVLFLVINGAFDGAGGAGQAALVVAIAIALISAPFWWGLLRRLTVERAARIRSQERAEVAAHLHDSVLQTLALIQRRTDDPAEVAQLARRQERELRTWLSGPGRARPGERLADALREAAEQVEEAHGAPIEAVVVGDAALDEHLSALVAASREALTNAAKFAADGGPVRLYAEIEDGAARVWVDDRGPGFDPAAVPPDRRGLRESIIGRMERHGGSATITRGPEGGTEVELAIGGDR